VLLLTYTRYIRILGEIYTAHAWSLSVEENFYFFWPAVFRMGDQTRKNVALFLVGIVPAIRIFLFLHPASWIGEDSLFVRIDAIAMGCCTALYKDEILAKLERYWSRLFYLSIAVLFLLPWAGQFAFTHGFAIVLVPYGVLDGFIANTLIVTIMLYSIYGPKGVVFRILNSKIFNFIGILSYSIYLWQQIFLLPQSWWVTKFPQNILCLAGMALISYYLVEKPFLRMKARFAVKSVAANPAVATTVLPAEHT
jgi:peptidoglycan/LPS O-acetylase OafA/YrhL